MNDYIVNHPQFRKNTFGKNEVRIQTEIRPLIIEYLTNYFNEKGYKDFIGKAHKSFYWEGQEGIDKSEKFKLFGSYNYPDFIIRTPYLFAIEYKKSSNGSLVKQGIGQSIMHTSSGNFDYVYYLFHDENKDKKIKKSSENLLEKDILQKAWHNHNVMMKFV